MVEFGSAALMATIIKDKKLLVLQYSNFYNHPEVDQKYVLPGGRKEKEDKSLAGALVREVDEETDLLIKVLEVTHLDSFVNKPNGKIRPIAFYKCQILEDKEIKLSDEHKSYKWVSLEEAKTLDWVDDSFIRFLKKVPIS